MRYIKWLCILVLLSSSISCARLYGDQGLIKDHNTDYLKAESIPPLNIPPGYDSTSMETEYPVPDKDYPQNAKRISLIPPELNNPGK